MTKSSFVQLGFLCCLPNPQSGILIFIFFLIISFLLSEVSIFFLFLLAGRNGTASIWDGSEPPRRASALLGQPVLSGPHCSFLPADASLGIIHLPSPIPKFRCCRRGTNVAIISHVPPGRFPMCKISGYLAASLTHAQPKNTG